MEIRPVLHRVRDGIPQRGLRVCLSMEKAGFVVNVEAVVYRADRYLMIVRAEEETFGGGWLCFPGGTVDHGAPMDDVLERTARREVLEEVGLDVPGPWRYVESHTFDAGVPVLDVVLMAPSNDGEPQAISAAEVASVHWMTVDEIAAHPATQPWTRRTLTLAQAIQSPYRSEG